MTAPRPAPPPSRGARSRGSWRTRAGRVALAVLLAATLALPIAARAQEDSRPEWPLLEAEDGAFYAGPGGTGRTALLSLVLGEGGAARGTLLEATPARGGAPGLDFAFDGRVAREDGVARVRARAWPRTTEGPPQTVTIEAPLTRDGLLDPFARATVAIEGAGTRLALDAVGTMLDGGPALADGSFGVEARAPFFYAEPWASLDLAALARRGLDASLRDGLAQRRELPDAVFGVWWERRYASVASLDADLVSARVLTDVFTGGAHPNTWRETATFVRTGDDWSPVDLCGALAALDRPCAPDALREAVVDDLRRQEAAWVLDGTVDAGTPWLLDLFTLTPRGVRFEFDPYDVGPYVQGPFAVDLEFPLPDD